ncbi:MAG: hemerythrin domain-containing protein [Kofleriaceae bacterium]|nr:hemerythrin domain-containing protein [Kofleriaceae bacterium]MCL4223197.1 hemerythrin domain-containing protein [Myxococcales bacterium]
MSELLTTLVAEHVHIRRVLGALHDFAAYHVVDDPAPRPIIGQFVTYLREYVDGVHHHKEEDHLFEAMIRAGLPRDAGPIGCMRHDHDVGRGHVAVLADLAAGRGPLVGPDLVALARAVPAYVRLLTDHIHKENNVLYPMAEQLVGADDLAALDLVVPADGDAARRLEALGDTLADRYAAARIAS